MQNADEAALSPRQAEVAHMVVSGKSTREIALALTLSPRTVETHIGAIYNKYGVSSRAELISAVLGPAALSHANPAVSVLSVDTNLPARRAALLGRATDVGNIVKLIRESRLVTITGAGGVGKTRAALAVGEAMLADFTAGVWLVELSALARGYSVADVVARALNIESSAGVPAIESLRSQLRRKFMLIVLDNCEQLVTEVAAVADVLLRDCPLLRILATSREPLRIAGERTYRLPSLRVPSSAEALELDAVSGAAFASVELFAQRARAVDFAFGLTDENIAFVAEVCRRVDGIPLAIELAAARVNILPVNMLAKKVDSHLRILGSGDRTASPRHQTMHALIDWSYDLLEPHEQRMFERLSIFVGGCALPEVVAVCADDAVDEISALDMLSSLVDKSLVIVDTTGSQPRYNLLQTFAQYGREKLLARDDAATVARRYAVAFVSLAERLEVDYDAAPSTAWFTRAQVEVANFRAALEWTLEARHDAVLGQRLVAAMRPVWKYAEGARRWLGLASELIDEHTPANVAAAVRFATASCNFDLGQLEQTVVDCRQLNAVFERLGDPVRMTQIQAWEGMALFLLGQDREAQPLLARALEGARNHGKVTQVAYLLNIMAQVSFRCGDVLDGRAKCAEAVKIFESIGADRAAAMVGLNLADAEFSSGNVDRAVQIATSSLIAVRNIGLKLDIARGLVNLTGYYIAAGRWTLARGHAGEALKILKTTQHHMFFDTLQHLAAIVALAPNEDQRTARLSGASRLLGYADAHSKMLSYTRQANEQQEYDRIHAALREIYAEDDLGQLFAQGASLTLEHAIELAGSL